MKKMIRPLLGILLAVFAFSSMQAQKAKQQGKIDFEIEFSGLDDMTAGFLDGASMKMWFNQKMIKVNMDMGMATNVSFTDLKEHKTDVYVDAMGRKFHMEMTAADLEKDKKAADAYEIVTTEETKDIAGFQCTKVIIKDADTELDIWLTDEISASSQMNGLYEKLSGFPMEYSTDMNGLTMKLTAIKYEDVKLPKDVFEKPVGFETLSRDQIKGMMSK